MVTLHKTTKTVVQCLILVSLAFALGCSSKKKVEDSQGGGTGGDTSIDQTALNFDPSGSDSGKINGLNSINFEYDKSALTSSAKQTLAQNAEWMKSRAGTNVQIEGHCDSRGSIEYNLSLGERRAQAVKAYLVSIGVSAARLSVISYGKEKPLSSGDGEADHAQNRRANFVPLQ